MSGWLVDWLAGSLAGWLVGRLSPLQVLHGRHDAKYTIRSVFLACNDISGLKC